MKWKNLLRNLMNRCILPTNKKRLSAKRELKKFGQNWSKCKCTFFEEDCRDPVWPACFVCEGLVWFVVIGLLEDLNSLTQYILAYSSVSSIEKVIVLQMDERK